jgi:hypothetical protein
MYIPGENISISAGSFDALKKIGTISEYDSLRKYVVVKQYSQEKISDNCILPKGQKQLWVRPLKGRNQWHNQGNIIDTYSGYRKTWERHMGFPDNIKLPPKTSFVVDHIHNGVRANDRGYEYVRLGLILNFINSAFGGGMEQQFVEISKTVTTPTTSKSHSNEIRELTIFEELKLSGIRYNDFIEGNVKKELNDNQDKIISASLTGEWTQDLVDLLVESWGE